LHDIAALDRLGTPGCVVATEAFKPGAAAQSRALGLDAAVCWVPHPIQNRTAAELESVATGALPGILSLISSAPAARD